MSPFLCVLTDSFDSVLKEMIQINKPTYKVCVHCIILVQSCQIAHSLIDSYATCNDKRKENDVNFFIFQVSFKP